MDSVLAQLIIKATTDIWRMAEAKTLLEQLEQLLGSLDVEVAIVPRDEIVTLGPDDRYSAAEILRAPPVPPTPMDTQEQALQRHKSPFYRAKK